MRVAIFTDNDFDKVNGVTTTLKAVLRHADGRARPRIYTAADTAVETPEYFAVSSVGTGLPWYSEMRVYWPRMRQFARELRRDGVELIHVTTPGPVGLAGRWLAARLGLPCVGSYHTHLGEYARTLSRSQRIGDWLDHYMRWFYGPCTALLVPSRATERLLLSRGHRGERLRIWPRGVDAVQFSPTRALGDYRRQWRVDARRPAIVYVGRLSAEKGLAMIPRIQQLLHRRAVAHQFVFVGDGPMAATLRRDVPDGVFLGALPHDMVAAAMASADVFLFPSTTDSFGNVVLEAQASGLPTVVTDRGGPCEHVRHGETGFVCPAEDAGKFADVLLQLLRHQAVRQQMATAARAWAERFDWPRALEPLVTAWIEARAGAGASKPAMVFASGRTAVR